MLRISGQHNLLFDTEKGGCRLFLQVIDRGDKLEKCSVDLT